MPTFTLCDAWQLPTYAQPFIRVRHDDVSVPIIDNTVDITRNPSIVTVCWGDAPLTQLTCDTLSLDWDGSVRLGGFVTAVHVTHLANVEMDLAVMTVEAQPLMPQVKPYVSASYRDLLPYAPADVLDGIDDDVPEGVTTWIAELDSPLVGMMQDAMNQGHRIYCFGRLSGEDDGWDKLFALPILLESVTSFMQ